MNEAPAVRKAPPQAQSSGSVHTLMTYRQPYMSQPISSKRVCFYKSGDAQFSGLPVVINNRTFKTFEGLLDSLSKRVPLPFGVRTITTPRGHTTVHTLDQLHHGHSYICSDKRTVKPIDLERARRKPPPWYNARPVSNRRVAIRHQSPGPRSARRARRNEHAALLHTPKRLVVFRNGDPEEKHTLMLQKRTTHSFEALLGLVSETMHFPVLKLHTPDGRRVDGLPALILCSGVLVAAGREPFKRGNYDVQKPSAPTWLPAKSVGRLHPVSRKKKSITSGTRSRPFSPSSEHFIVNQIHNSFAGSAFDYPRNPTDSVEMETGQMLESVAETDTIACLDGEGDGEREILVPTEDDIEKSFRVNQDGSMTVEMKVRLTIKEEETIHWTTTLSRSNVTNQMKTEPHPDLGATLSDTVPLNVNPVGSEAIKNCPDAFSMENPDEMQTGRADDVISVKESLPSLPSTPGWRKVEQKQSVGSTVKVTESEIQESLLGSYAYREETSNGEMKQEHCMVRQCRSRPVPKPRINLPSELNTTSTQLQSNTQHYESAQILKLQDIGEAVRETVLHIYEQQSCGETLLANTQLCMPGMGAYGSVNSLPASGDTVLPASSENTMRSSSEDLESMPMDSGTYGSIKRQEKTHTLCQQSISQKFRSKKSKPCTPVIDISKASETTITSTANSDTNKRRKPVRVIVKKNHIFQIPAPDQKRKDNTTNMFKEIRKIRADMFSQAGTMRHTEHYKSKAVHKLLKRRNNQPSHERIVPHLLHNPVQLTIESPNEISAEKEEYTNTVNPVHVDLIFSKPKESSPPPKKDLLRTSTNTCTLTRQMSMHEERNFQRETRELSESISLPALHSSSSVFNEYVELWLQKSVPDQEQVQEDLPQPILEKAEKTDSSNEDIPCYVSTRKPQSSTSTSVEKITSIKATTPKSPSPEKNAIPIKDIKRDITSTHHTETKSPQKSSTAQKTKPQTLSMKNIYNKNISSEESLLLSDNSSEKKIIPDVSHGETLLTKKVNVKNIHATSDNNSASSESSNRHLSNQEKMPFPENITKMSCQSEDSSLESSGNTERQTPLLKNTAEKTLLLSQASVEKIPKNNTLTKASLFDHQHMEETPLSTKVTSDRRPAPRHSSQIKVSESNITLWSKLQASIDVPKTKEISIIPQVDTADAQVKSATETTSLQAEKLYTVKMAVRPDMRHVLEELCQSIHSFSEVTQQKRRSRLEKSNSMPDFSSQLASTFGSSSRVLLAFLSVMTLKDGLANLNTCRQAQDNLSCSEALLMLQSLKEMAAMEDADRLRSSLNALQSSTSAQLLQSWRGFQELSSMSRSHSVTLGSSRSGSCSEEEAIQGLMEELGVPERVREEIAALCPQEEESIEGNQVEGLESEERRESLAEAKINGFTESIVREDSISFADSVLEKDVNLYVTSVIENAVNAHSKDGGSSDVSKMPSLVSTGADIEEVTERHDQEFSPEKTANCGLDTDVCEDLSYHEPVLEEKQQRKREVVPVRHVRKQEKDPEPQSIVKDKSMKESTACSECAARTTYIMEESPKHHVILDNNEGNKGWMDTKEPGEITVTENRPNSFETPSSEDKTNTSEEDKYSLEEEEDSCDEELMSFSEDHASDKEEKVNPITIHSEDHRNTTIAPLSTCQRETQVSQTQSQLHSHTDCVEQHTTPPERQVTLIPIHVESNVKEDMAQDSGHDTDQQQVIYEERIIYSDEDQMVLEAPECYTIYQEHFVEENEYGPEEVVEFEEERKRTSVAELISTLESVTQGVSSKPKKPVNRHLDPSEVLDISDTDVSQISSEQDRMEELIKDPWKVQTQDRSGKSGIQQVSKRQSPKQNMTSKQSHMDFTSEPLSSSLAFSYDSRSSSLAQDPEGSIHSNRVKSIREMFLAKSNTTSQNGQRKTHSPNSDMSDYQTESTEDSGGNGSQTTPETSSGEDDTSRLAIAKGFVRRTIERLYGRGNSNSTGPERPLSASKGMQKEGPGRTNVTNLASFHEAQTRVRTDISYFNATSLIDVINEPSHCVTLNAQVRPEDAVLIDKGRWLLRENQPITESSQELQEAQRKVEKNSSTVNEPEQDATKEDVPYSLFCPASPHSILPSTDLEELSRSPEQKFTYFNLPNASDSELEPEGRNTDTPSKREAKGTPITQSPKSWAEKNSFLPAFNPPVVKRTDNKVHPLLEALTLPVVTQPGRGQGAKTEVARRSTEPDVLEMLFSFCGQHCPIL
ncbi:hypothetical protein AMEX_G10855 [Astyanax mexicanus]|uniref:Doublecortin domain-containing protein n=1 Tax=Astyanax mexicanus TaxID=7994 RepID=A0A8T2LRG0_ASTMX|nr:hypothetical protein AMEX_G10855 [Astyanax mexicanus]